VPPPDPGQALRRFLGQASPGDYVALHAYLPPSEEHDRALASLRASIRAATGLATTIGYGPRFLHSTGQLHKGDGGRGLFVQLVADPTEDLPIPERAGATESTLSFGVLLAAQALGDHEALRRAGRRVVRLSLGRKSAAEIVRLGEAL